ncbi:MAG: transporter substrate-binding domain-containing protein [Clostridia bacterium]|nr:transporter substrate-binding domain-containing protein [Clostridia bacterium]
MKKLLTVVVAGLLAVLGCFSLTACGKKNKIYVDTNAFFAPFEYYEGKKIVGADIDIMNKVGEKLGKKVVFTNTDFDVIIDNVSSGKKYDCGAAGITITDARKEKVDFSNPYFKSVQYVIFKADDSNMLSKVKTATDNVECVFWADLAGKKLGVQRDTTGDIYANLEIDGEGEEGTEDYYPGELNGSGATVTPYDSAQLAVDAINANQIDVVIVDKLPAEYICNKNNKFVCKALYYDEETATEEEYAICVTKGNTELLNAINEVLDELGDEGIQKLVAKHLGISD